MKVLHPLLLAMSLAGVCNAASYTVNSGSAVNLGVSGSDVQFVIPKFDTNLGTLTGVTVKVVQSNLTGSFSVTNAGATSFVVDKVTSDFRVRENTPGLGYSLQFVEIDPLATSPGSSPSATIAPTESLVFNINNSQGYTVSDQNINSSFFSAYNGPGNVVFDIRNRVNISVTGATYTVDSANTYTTTQMAITYTYEAVPEPSATLLGGLGALALLRRRRR